MSKIHSDCWALYESININNLVSREKGDPELLVKGRVTELMEFGRDGNVLYSVYAKFTPLVYWSERNQCYQDLVAAKCAIEASSMRGEEVIQETTGIGSDIYEALEWVRAVVNAIIIEGALRNNTINTVTKEVYATMIGDINESNS